MEIKELILENRDILKADWWGRFGDFTTDQQAGLTRPDVQKPAPAGAPLIDLVPPEELTVGDVSLRQLIANRRSRRVFSDQPLSLEELSFLVWSVQGVSDTNTDDGVTYYRRTAPSGGNRHPFETYLSVHHVTGLEVGLYRYLPLSHQLVQLRVAAELPQQTSTAALNQSSVRDGKPFHFIENSAVTFVWTAIPYRTEWRYGPAAAKLIAVDAGHFCENLYLACGAIQAGMVAVGAFDRPKMDAVLGVDGKDEFSLYVAPVGKLPD